jgi:hypothetical protein
MARRKIFYVVAEDPGQDGFTSETICNFGRTVGRVSDRRSHHERKSPQKVGRYVPLEVCFKATGSITEKERHIRRLTAGAMLDGHNRNSEWRKCHPRELIQKVMREANKRGWTCDVKFSCFT